MKIVTVYLVLFDTIFIKIIHVNSIYQKNLYKSIDIQNKSKPNLSNLDKPSLTRLNYPGLEVPNIRILLAMKTSNLKEDKPVAAPTSTSPADTEKPVVSNTNVLPNQANSTNAIGKLGPSNYSISSPPYIVRSCDQILLIPAKTILDDNDYGTKTSSFFTMNIYLINLFESADNTKLINSIYLQDINRVPDIVKGTKDCLGFFDDKHKKKIFLCYDQPKDITDAFNSFTRCRAGDNLKGENAAKIKEIILKKKCLGLGKKKNKTEKYGKWTPKYITKVPGS